MKKTFILSLLSGFGLLSPATAQEIKFFGYMGFSGRIDQPLKAIATGGEHNIVLKEDGTVAAWGVNSSGQCNTPLGLTGVKFIEGGGSHSLALKEDGTVVAWGNNDSGQCSIPSGLLGVKAIAAGYEHSLALKEDGTVVAWGNDNYGQSSVPLGLTGVKAISAGASHSLALKEDGTVVAWGDDTYGQTAVPQGLTGVEAISAGDYHSLALKEDGTVAAWGNQNNVPLGLTGVKAIATGANINLALKDNGSVVAWGSNLYNQNIVPSGLTGVKAIAAGNNHCLALKDDGTYVGWGKNEEGQSKFPSGLVNIKVISEGGSHFLGLKKDGTVVGWGNDDIGQSTPPFGLTGVTSIVAGGFLSLALKEDGTVVAWGENTYGQSTVPFGLTGVKAIAAGIEHSLALKEDGTVVAWGYDGGGRSTVPVDLTGVRSITAGNSHNLALKDDGTVVAWGEGYSVQTTVLDTLKSVKLVVSGGSFSLALKEDGTVVAWGDSSNGKTTVPIGLKDVIAISAGDGHSLALKKDGTVVAWGYDGDGQTSVPFGLGDVKAIVAGPYHSIALKTNGTVVAWGKNSEGQTNIPHNLTGVKAIAAMGNTTICLLGEPNDDADSLKSIARGRIIRDNNLNCKKDSNEFFIKDFPVKALPGPVYGYSNAGGEYKLELDTNVNYIIKPIIPYRKYSTFQNNCDTSKTVSFAGSGIDSSGFDFHIKYNTCHYLTVDVASDRRRRCFKSNTTVRYCNAGAATAKNVQIFVEFPTFVRLVSSNWSYTQISDSLYRFDIDSVTPNYCGQINIVDSVVCGNEEIRGLTQCTKAWITPVNNCNPTAGWDRSDLQVISECMGNGLYQLKVINTGTGDMDAFRQIRIDYSHKLTFTDSFKLKAGDSLIYEAPFNGRTIRAEVDQHPLHPNKKVSSITLENCGANKIVQMADKGLTLTYPLNDEEPEMALDCQIIRDSYDPNDKQAVPAALLPPGKPVDYMIRFQNTGNDTAYTVVVVDTLDERFDMATFQITGSSHPYSFKLSGTGTPVLKFTYNYINLPDSTTDEPKSHGYIKFRITPMDTVPEESILKNKAEIYFDFNSSIVTNTVILRVKDSVATEPGTSLRDSIKRVEVISAQAENLPNQEPQIYPNPNTGEFTLKAAPGSNYILYNLTGTPLQSGTGTSTETIISATGLPKGIYLLQITNAEGVWMKKVVVQ